MGSVSIRNLRLLITINLRLRKRLESIRVIIRVRRIWLRMEACQILIHIFIQLLSWSSEACWTLNNLKVIWVKDREMQWSNLKNSQSRWSIKKLKMKGGYKTFRITKNFGTSMKTRLIITFKIKSSSKMDRHKNLKINNQKRITINNF